MRRIVSLGLASLVVVACATPVFAAERIVADPLVVTGTSEAARDPYISMPRGAVSVEVSESVDYDPSLMTEAAAYAALDTIAQAKAPQIDLILGAMARGDSAASEHAALGGLAPAGLEFSRTTTATDHSGCTRTVRFGAEGADPAIRILDIDESGCRIHA